MFEAFSIYGKIALQGMGVLNQELSGLQQKVKQVGTNMQSAGKKMTMGLTLPLVALGGAAFKMSGDFDQAMRATNVMLKASESEMKSYKSEILDLSKSTGKSSGDIAKSFYTIVSAGYRGADAMDILTTSMEGAVGGAAEATSTTEALTKAMNIFQLKGVEGANRAMDVFFGIVDTGLLTFEELAQAFPMAATSAAGLQVSIEETGAALATLTKVSGSTRMASTALNAVFTQLIKPSEDMMDLFKEWGVETGPEAIEKFGGLQGVLLKVTEATGGNVSELAKLFPNVEAIRAVLPLTTTNAQDFADALETVSNSTGRAGEAFDEMAQGPGYQLNVFLATMKALMITIGDTVSKKLGPILTTFTEKIGKLSKWIENLTEEQANLYLKLGLVLAAAGPVLYIFGTMITTVNTLTTSFIAMRVAAHGALGPITVAIAIIVAHYIAVKKLSRYIENDFARSLLMSSSLIGSVTEAVNIWQRATWVADQTQQGLFRTLFMGRRNFNELEESLIAQEVYYNKVARAALGYAEEFPGISRELQDLINLLNEGTISQEAFEIGTQEIIGTTQDYIKYQRLLNEAISPRQIVIYEDKIKELARSLGIATDDSRDFADIQSDVDEALGIVEEGADDAAGAIDDLRSAFNNLTDDLFGTITTYNDFQEANWAVEDATKAVAESEKELKKAQDATGSTFIKNDAALHTYLSTNEEYVKLNERANELQTKANELFDKGEGNTSDYYNTLGELKNTKDRLNGIIREGTRLTGESISTNEQSAEQLEIVAEKTRQLEEDMNALDAANIKAIQTAFELSTEVGITTEEQEEARKKAFEVGAEYVNTGRLGIEAFIKIASQFDLSSEEIISRAEEVGIDVNNYFKETADKSIENFIALATQFGLSGTEIMDKAEEIGIDIDTELKNAAEKGIGNFEALAKSFGLEGQAIIDKSYDVGIELDTATRFRILGIDTVDAMTNVRSLIDLMALVKSKTVTIKAVQISEMGAKGGRVGSLDKFAGGGTTSNRSVLVGELGPEIAEFPVGTRIIPNNQIGERLSESAKMAIQNIYNITTPEPLTESEISRQVDLTSRELGYKWGLR